jgi:hypothetical protein
VTSNSCRTPLNIVPLLPQNSSFDSNEDSTTVTARSVACHDRILDWRSDLVISCHTLGLLVLLRHDISRLYAVHFGSHHPRRLMKPSSTAPPTKIQRATYPPLSWSCMDTKDQFTIRRLDRRVIPPCVH